VFYPGTQAGYGTVVEVFHVFVSFPKHLLHQAKLNASIVKSGLSLRNFLTQMYEHSRKRITAGIHCKS